MSAIVKEVRKSRTIRVAVGAHDNVSSAARRRRSLLVWTTAISAWACFRSVALAQTDGAPSIAGGQRVVIEGSSEAAVRQTSIGSKIVIARDQIAQFADTNLLDVLRRIPGLSVTSSPGKGVELSMRGMAAGYLQLLINGDTASQAIGLDALDPALIERIEVQRTATAEQSTQAIAGTVNIVLRRTSPGTKKGLKINLVSQDGRLRTTGVLSLADEAGTVDYSAVASLSRIPSRVLSVDTVRTSGPSVSKNERVATDSVADTAYVASLTPQFTWKIDSKQDLKADLLLRAINGRLVGTEVVDTVAGPLPDYVGSDWKSNLARYDARLKGAWSRHLGPDQSVDVTMIVNGGNAHRTTELVASSTSDTAALVRHVAATERLSGSTIKAKYKVHPSDDSQIAVGVDLDRQRRRETRQQMDTFAAPRSSTFTSDEFYSGTLRYAGYVQWDRDWGKAVSTSAGVRYEHASTIGEASGASRIGTSTGIASPILQAMWRPGTNGDTVRIAVSRTFRMPSTSELIARRRHSINNSVTAPDTRGNPDLRPELAAGIDLSYEHNLSKREFVSIAAFSRRIDDPVIQDLRYVDGAWLQSPINAKAALVRGLEAEAKLQFKSIGSLEIPVDLAGNMVRTWSRVMDTSIQAGALEGQTPLTGNVSASVSVRQGVKLSLAANYTKYLPIVRRPTTTFTGATKRTLDLACAWAMSRRATLNFAVGNLLPRSEQERTEYRATDLQETRIGDRPTYRTFRVSADIGL